MLKLALAFIILVFAVVDDLRWARYRNPFFIVSLICAVLMTLILDGVSAAPWTLLNIFLSLILSIPLHLAKVIGGGDVKLFTVVAVLNPWQSLLGIVLFALFWGAIFGLVRAGLDGQLKALIKNSVSVVRRQKPAVETLHRIPFTVALLFGWLSEISLSHVGWLV